MTKVTQMTVNPEKVRRSFFVKRIGVPFRMLFLADVLEDDVRGARCDRWLRTLGGGFFGGNEVVDAFLFVSSDSFVLAETLMELSSGEAITLSIGARVL